MKAIQEQISTMRTEVEANKVTFLQIVVQALAFETQLATADGL